MALCTPGLLVIASASRVDFLQGWLENKKSLRLIGRLLFIFIVSEVNSRLLCPKMVVQGVT